MKPLAYHPAARAELDEAGVYYETQRRGLGRSFEQAVRNALDRIQANPATGFPSEHGTRTLRVKRFPYGLVFREHSDEIRIVAVAHFHRREDYWADRIEDEESA